MISWQQPRTAAPSLSRKTSTHDCFHATAPVDRNKALLRFVDQGSILLVVYAAFSEAVGQGLWQQLTPATFFNLGVVSCVLLALQIQLMVRHARAALRVAHRLSSARPFLYIVHTMIISDRRC